MELVWGEFVVRGVTFHFWSSSIAGASSAAELGPCSDLGHFRKSLLVAQPMSTVASLEFAAPPIVAVVATATTLVTCVAVAKANDRYLGGLTWPYFSDMGRGEHTSISLESVEPI